MKRVSPHLFASFSLILFIISLYPILSLNYTMKWDNVDQFYPYRDFISTQLHEFKFPLWNPYINYGYPFYTDPQSAVFYPITLFFCALLSYSVGTLNIEWLFHIIIAFIGLYLFLISRKVKVDVSVFTAILFCCCGVFVSNAQHLTWIISISWLPWIFYFYYKCWNCKNIWSPIGMAIVCFFALTGGYPVFLIIIFYLLFIHFIITNFVFIIKGNFKTCARVFIYFILSSFIFLILTAPYIYSWLSIMPYISRGSSLSYEAASVNPFSFQAFITLIYPLSSAADFGFFKTDLSMNNGFIGTFVISFALLSSLKILKVKSYQWLFTAIVFLLISVGNNLPVHKFLYEYIPGFNMFRHPSIFRVFFMFFSIIFFAENYDKLSIKNFTILIGFTFLINLSTCVILIAKQVVLPFSILNVYKSFYVDGFIFHRILINAILTATVSVISYFLLSKLKFQETKLLFLLFILVEMVVVFRVLTPISILSDQKIIKFNRALNDLKSNNVQYDSIPIGKITSIGDGSLNPMWYNTSMLTHRVAFDGFNSFYLNSLDSLNNSVYRPFSMKTRLFETIFPNEQSSAVQIFSDSISRSQLHVQTIKPGYSKVIVETKEPVYLQFQQAFHKGWKAKVNNSDAKILRLNHHLMTVKLNSGYSEIEFSYEDLLVKILTTISLSVLVLLLAIKLFTKVSFY